MNYFLVKIANLCLQEQQEKTELFLQLLVNTINTNCIFSSFIQEILKFVTW